MTSTRVLYNPDLKDLWFILPAIVGMIMQTLAVAQAALIVVKEREIGTIEQILATPTRPLELILGKMIPLLVICLLVTGVILGLGVFWFGVPFVGSLWLFFWLSLIFIGSSLGIGLLISPIFSVDPHDHHLRVEDGRRRQTRSKSASARSPSSP